eukprot:m.94518 g.94518  ORF g.94518 m.94518 type:complete len:68 (-) comp8923_c0_seq1:2400-2603(-)
MREISYNKAAYPVKLGTRAEKSVACSKTMCAIASVSGMLPFASFKAFIAFNMNLVLPKVLLMTPMIA